MTIRITPTMQIRIIGPDTPVHAIGAELTRCARALLGPHYTYRTTTRPARRVGHTRLYLTVTRKETFDSP